MPRVKQGVAVVISVAPGRNVLVHEGCRGLIYADGGISSGARYSVAKSGWHSDGKRAGAGRSRNEQRRQAIVERGRRQADIRHPQSRDGDLRVAGGVQRMRPGVGRLQRQPSGIALDEVELERVVAGDRVRDQMVECGKRTRSPATTRSEEHTSELQSRGHLVCRLLLEKKKKLQ